MVPTVPSLEKEEDKPGWSLREQPEGEVTGMQEGITSNEILLLEFPACLPLVCIPRMIPDSV